MNNNLHEEEKEFEKLKKHLQSLKKVAAPPGFEANLMRKINQEKFATQQEGFFSKIFSKLILWPAAGFTIAVIAFVMLRSGGPDEVNPWTQAAKERPDIIAVSADGAIPDSPNIDKSQLPVPDKNLTASRDNEPETGTTVNPETEFTSSDPSQFSGKSAVSKPALADSLKKEKSTPLMFKVSSSNKEEIDSLKNRIFKKRE